MTKAMVQRAASGLKAAFVVHDLIGKTMAIVELEQLVDQTSTRLGDKARMARTVGDRQAAVFREYLALSAKYQSLLPPVPK